MALAKPHFYSSQTTLTQHPGISRLHLEVTQPVLNALLFTSVDGAPTAAKAWSYEMIFWSKHKFDQT